MSQPELTLKTRVCGHEIEITFLNKNSKELRSSIPKLT
jgi:hypothetical protein